MASTRGPGRNRMTYTGGAGRRVLIHDRPSTEAISALRLQDDTSEARGVCGG